MAGLQTGDPAAVRTQAHQLRVRAQRMADQNWTLWKAVRPMGFRGPAGDRYRRSALARFRRAQRIIEEMRQLARDLDRTAARMEAEAAQAAAAHRQARG